MVSEKEDSRVMTLLNFFIKEEIPFVSSIDWEQLEGRNCSFFGSSTHPNSCLMPELTSKEGW